MNSRSKTVKVNLAGLLVLLTSAVSQANEQTHSALEQANLKKALYCMDILENRPDLEPSNRLTILRNECFSEAYIQHSPHVADGREAVLSLFAKRYESNAEITTSIKRTASEGDLVWLHQHVKRNQDDLGRAVINIFRMENGKFIEHWNVSQAVPKESKNNNTMF